MFELIETYRWLFLLLLGIVGLAVGSFLNVVIYRLPLFIQKNWEDECSELFEQKMPETNDEVFNLACPPSHCPACKKKLKWLHNIPIFSYLALKGKCAFCRKKISLRYPIVEILSSATAVVAGLEFGISPECLLICLFSWLLIAISFIDLETQLIPDILSQFLLWLGLLAGCFELFTNSHDAILGAILGYSTLWLVHKLFQLIRKKTGMGSGDFKLFAAVSAWLGWQLLPFIILTSSFLGLITGIILLHLKKIKKETPIPFAPFIAIAAWIAIIWGFDITHYYFQFIHINWSDV